MEEIRNFFKINKSLALTLPNDCLATNSRRTIQESFIWKIK